MPTCGCAKPRQTKCQAPHSCTNDVITWWRARKHKYYLYAQSEHDKKKGGGTENKSSLLVVFYKLICICPLIWFLSPLKANQASVNKGLPQHLLQQTQWLSF